MVGEIVFGILIASAMLAALCGFGVCLYILVIMIMEKVND